MITIGRKMGKGYNSVIKLTELFSGNHPLAKAYSPDHPLLYSSDPLSKHP
jgi:cysteinyl-tRNA synthetase